MNLVDHFARLFTYDDWANREVLANLQAAPAASPQSLKLVAHVLAAERLWLERLSQQEQTLPVWPQFTIEQCDDQLAALASLWKNYLAAGSEAELEKSVSYRNSKGEAWSSRKEDILMHVIMHSAYHRGQVATAVRAAGSTPAYTDFIHSVRQGFVK
ncbi:MAG TPA: DinB family protein [Terriglobales bacterium]|jgi:uncharacterized damage-inducible protein DinB|nr:DinB family protein [Terriglobales bacterium]